MLKAHFWFVLALLIFGTGLVVSAQEEITLASTTEIDLRAGAVGSAAFLAPDGEHFAHLSRDTICVYAGTIEQWCTDLLERIGEDIQPESIRWSPDSRYLTFTEDFFRMFIESDIWVLDTTDGTLTNLTDDGQQGQIDLDAEKVENIDALPLWLDDGRILFVRYTRMRDDIVPLGIYVISPDGTGEEKTGELNLGNEWFFVVRSLDISGDQLVYSIQPPTLASPLYGIWTSDLDGANPEQILQGSPELLLSSVDASPDGSYALFTVQPGRNAPEDSPIRVVDMATGEVTLIDSERYVDSAGWSPNESALVYTVLSSQNEDQNGVYITTAPGVSGHLLLAGTFIHPTIYDPRFYTWSANNTVLLARFLDAGVILAHLE